MAASDLNGNKYAQLAAEWGIDPDDAVIKLLEAFDRRFEELQADNRELRSQIGQWTGITTQLLGLVRDQNQDSKTLSSHTKTLSEFLEKLSQELQNFEQTTASQQEICVQLQRDTQSLQSSVRAIDQTVQTLPSTATLASSEQRIVDQIKTSGGRGESFYFRACWYVLGASTIAFFFMGGVGYSLGQRNGFEAGQAELAGQFGGAGNLDFWKQMRNQNKERVAACQNQNQAECRMDLPQ